MSHRNVRSYPFKFMTHYLPFDVRVSDTKKSDIYLTPWVFLNSTIQREFNNTAYVRINAKFS